MKNLNQPYDLNRYTPFQRRANPYDLSSEPIKPRQVRTERGNPYDLSQRRLQTARFPNHVHQADLSE